MLVWLLNFGLRDLDFGLLLRFATLSGYFVVTVAVLGLFNEDISRPRGGVASSDLKNVDGPIFTFFLGLFIVSFCFLLNS